VDQPKVGGKASCRRTGSRESACRRDDMSGRGLQRRHRTKVGYEDIERDLRWNCNFWPGSAFTDKWPVSRA
jgi:hypothetical protein